MEQFILAVIVGLLSGALASVLGPLVAHRLGRRQREERRREQRHAELRAMVEDAMSRVRRHFAGAYQIAAEVLFGRSTLEAHVRYFERESAERPFIVWRPHRIGDDELRRMAERLNQGDLKLQGHIDACVHEFPLDEVEDIMSIDVDTRLKAMLAWIRDADELMGGLQDLVERIDLRLDELGW